MILPDTKYVKNKMSIYSAKSTFALVFHIVKKIVIRKMIKSKEQRSVCLYFQVGAASISQKSMLISLERLPQ